MALTGWIMTLAGSGVVLFWLAYEAIQNFSHAPLATAVGVFVVLGLMTLLVPVPLLLASRRARSNQATQR
jgi:hypothetical protein